MREKKPRWFQTWRRPLTGTRVVDIVITDLGVFTVDKQGGTGLTLIELAEGVSLEEITEKTEAPFKAAL